MICGSSLLRRKINVFSNKVSAAYNIIDYIVGVKF